VQKYVENQPVPSENTLTDEASANGARTPIDALTTDAGEGIDMAGFDSTSGKSPAFQFYPSDFMGDGKQAGMSLQECGAYIRLICVCWNDGSIPDDVTRIAHIVGTNKSTMVKLWPAVRACFKEKNGRLVHKRLEEERRKQADFRRRQSDASRKRWDKPKPSHGNATALPVDIPNASSSIFSLQSSSSDFRRTAAAETPTNGRSKRPIYTSDRFAVFEWQLDELGRTLGSHTEAFDLHSFFDGLSQQSRDSGLVIPRDDVWPWLQAQVLTEAKRRGLPIASAEASAEADRAAQRRKRDEAIMAGLREAVRAGR
jgi:uncharacterized protein YdaU (DUF1376 family)